VEDVYTQAGIVVAVLSLGIGLAGHRMGGRLAGSGPGRAIARSVGVAFVIVGVAALAWGVLGVGILAGCRADDCGADAVNWLGVLVLVAAGPAATATGGIVAHRPGTARVWLGPGGAAATLGVAGFLFAA